MGAQTSASNVVRFNRTDSTPVSVDVAPSRTSQRREDNIQPSAEHRSQAPPKIVPITRVKGRTFKQPIYVIVESFEGGVIVTAHDLDIFETGEDEDDALASLREAISEVADVLLGEDEASLSEELADQRRYLTSLLA